MRASSAPHLVSARSGGGHGFHYPDNKVRASSAPHLVTARSWGSHGFQYPDNKVRASSVPHLVLACSGGGHGFQYPDNKVCVSYPTLYSFNTSSLSHTSPGGADYVSSVLSYVLWIGFILKFKVFYVHFFFFTLTLNGPARKLDTTDRRGSYSNRVTM